MIKIVLIAVLLAPTAALCDDTLSHHQIGGPDSLKYEIVGLESDFTDKALDAEALRACPRGYQSDGGEGFTKSDGSKWWRFTLFCLDPAAEGPAGNQALAPKR